MEREKSSLETLGLMKFGETFKGRKVLITGHTGFKGSWLSLWLSELKAKVTGYSIDIPTTPSLFEALDLKTLINDKRGDVRDLQSLQETFKVVGPEIVFHMAAQPLVRESYNSPKLTFDVNAGGTVNVLECVRQSQTVKAVVVVTTDKCYENLETDHSFIEEDKLGGHDPYSASKACAEIITGAYARSFFAKSDKWIGSARAGNVIGGGDWAEDRLIPDSMTAWSKKESVKIRKPLSRRPWQHVLEPLCGYLMIGEELLKQNENIRGQAFNFGPDDSDHLTAYEIIKAMSQFWPGSQLTVEIPTNNKALEKHEALMLRLNCEKAKRLLQWKPRLKVEEMMEWTSSWYQMFYAEYRCDLKSYSLEQINRYVAKT